MGEERAAERILLPPLPWKAQRHGEADARRVRLRRGIEHPRHLGEPPRVAGPALRGEIGKGGLVGGAIEGRGPLRLVHVELALRDLLDLQRERTQRVLLGDPGEEERFLEELRRGERVRLFAAGPEVEMRRRQQLARRPQDDDRVVVALGRAEAVAGALLRGLGDEGTRVVARDLHRGDDALPRHALHELAPRAAREAQGIGGEDAADVGDHRLHHLHPDAGALRVPDRALAVGVDAARVAGGGLGFRLGPQDGGAGGSEILDLDALLLEPLQLALRLLGERLGAPDRHLAEHVLPARRAHRPQQRERKHLGELGDALRHRGGLRRRLGRLGRRGSQLFEQRAGRGDVRGRRRMPAGALHLLRDALGA